MAKSDLNQKQTFGWIELKTKYAYLKSTFEEILLEKVREFDVELTEMVKTRVTGIGSNITVSPAKILQTEADSLANTEAYTQRPKSVLNLRSSRFCKIAPPKRLNPEEPRFNFSNVAIRDTTKFTLKKWGRAE